MEASLVIEMSTWQYRRRCRRRQQPTVSQWLQLQKDTYVNNLINTFQSDFTILELQWLENWSLYNTERL